MAEQEAAETEATVAEGQENKKGNVQESSMQNDHKLSHMQFICADKPLYK